MAELVNPANPTPDPADPAAPEKKMIRVGVILNPEDLQVGIEDVLAARVMKKTLWAQAAVFAVIAGMLVYVGWDIKNTKADIKQQQKELQASIDSAQSRIASREKEIQQHVDSSRAMVGSAGALVGSANTLIGATTQYQDALTRNLQAIGSNQTRTEQMQGEMVGLRSTLDNEIEASRTARGEAIRRRQADSILVQAQLAASKAANDSLLTIATNVTNSFTQLVDEDTPTQVGSSNFVFAFDDLERGDRQATLARLTHAGAPVEVPEWSRGLAPLARPVDVTVNGQRYRVTLLDGRTRRRWLVSRKQRLVVQILWLPSAANTRQAGAATTATAALAPQP